MSLIDRENTIDSLQTFIDRYIGSTGCKWKEKDEYFIEGIKYAIRSIKLQEEAKTNKQIGFDFSEDCQWK